MTLAILSKRQTVQTPDCPKGRISQAGHFCGVSFSSRCHCSSYVAMSKATSITLRASLEYTLLWFSRCHWSLHVTMLKATSTTSRASLEYTALTSQLIRGCILMKRSLAKMKQTNKQANKNKQNKTITTNKQKQKTHTQQQSNKTPLTSYLPELEAASSRPCL